MLSYILRTHAMGVKKDDSDKIRSYLGEGVSDGVVGRVYSEYIVSSLNISLDNYLINHKEYKSRIHEIYCSIVKEYLGPDSQYLKKSDYIVKLVPHPISEEAIRGYVLSIEDLRIERSKINILDSSLSRDVGDMIEAELIKRGKSVDVLSEYDKRNAILSVTDMVSCVRVYLDSLDRYCRMELSGWIDDMFRDVHGRNITIPEYVNYYKIMIGCNSVEEVREIMEEKHVHFLACLLIGRNIHKEYLGFDISEEEFGRRFIDVIDNKDWDENVKMDIVAGDYENERYRECVSGSLRAIYNSVWNCDTEDYNIEHMFNICKLRGYSGCSHGLDEVVVFVEEATKKYKVSIGEIYERILRRSPDVNEVRESLVLYRENENENENSENENSEKRRSESSLEDVLYDSIEYNEVIKCKIHDIHKDKNLEILPSNVYRILKKILEDNKLKRDDIEMSEFISRQLPSQEPPKMGP